jgi:hypothetical protein
MKSKTDRTKIKRTTDANIRRHMAEDGQGPERDLSSFALVIPPQVLRKHLGMTQSEFAKALRLFSTADGGLQALPRGGHQRRPPGQFGTVGAGLLLEYGERRWFEAHIAENRRKQLSLDVEITLQRIEIHCFLPKNTRKKHSSSKYLISEGLNSTPVANFFVLLRAFYSA